MSDPIAFILNRHAGSSADGGWLKTHRAAVEAVAAGGPIIEVADGDEIRAAVKTALQQGCKTIVAGGGDGTLSAVASLLIGQPVTFGVLPLGTLNHFAKDLGVPIDPLQALQGLPSATAVEVDVAEVNGHYFLNNSSIGLYVDIVRDRERQQTRLGRGKWPAFAWALAGAMRRFPFLTVTLSSHGKPVEHRTPMVFVGNNVYRTDGLQIGERDALQAGVLCVYLTERTGRWRLFTLGLRALAGRVREEKDFQVLLTDAVRIDTRRSHMRVAMDGEVKLLEAPLRYRIHPRALRVLLPAKPQGD